MSFFSGRVKGAEPLTLVEVDWLRKKRRRDIAAAAAAAAG
jgi:hypothetical protein